MTVLLALLVVAALVSAWLAVQLLWLRAEGAEAGADALAGRGCARSRLGGCSCPGERCERREGSAPPEPAETRGPAHPIRS